MSLLNQTRIRLTPTNLTFVLQKRYNLRQSIHKYVEPDKFKKHMLAATQPYIKKVYKLPQEKCKGFAPKEHELEPLDRIFAQELTVEIEKNDFFLVIQHNYTPFQSERVYKNTLTKAGGTFYSHKNGVYKRAFETLKMSELQRLLVTRNSLIVGSIDKLPGCVKALNKMPSFLLLAGCIERRLFNHEQLQMISATSNLDTWRAILLDTLSSPAIELSHSLQRYIDVNTDEKSDQPQ